MARSKSADETPLPDTLATPFERFLETMEHKKGLAANTLDAYRRDLGRYLRHLANRAMHRLLRRRSRPTQQHRPLWVLPLLIFRRRPPPVRLLFR